MACTPSSNASSMFTSSTCAPLSTCCLATLNASSYLSSLISLANFLLPVTLVRSPTFTKLVSGRMTKGSRPLRRKYGLIVFILFFCYRLRNIYETSLATLRSGLSFQLNFCSDNLILNFRDTAPKIHFYNTSSSTGNSLALNLLTSSAMCLM